jgi:uncharacterized protein (DUF1697 family)
MRYIAFLRNVTLGQKGLSRALLLEAFAKAGGADVESFISSGNVVFSAASRSAQRIANQAMAHVALHSQVNEPAVVRSLPDLQALAQGQPFVAATAASQIAAAQGDQLERWITFFCSPAPEPCPLALPWVSPKKDLEIFSLDSSQALSLVGRINGIAGSPTAALERALRIRVTTRNWNTVERMLARFG